MSTHDLIKALQPITSRVRTDVTAIKVPEGGSRWVSEPLTPARLAKHLEGGLPRGCCPIHAGQSVTRLALLDLDSHKGEISWPDMADIAGQIIAGASMEGIELSAYRSSGGNGMHLYALWDKPQDAYSVRQLFVDILRAVGLKSGTGGLAKSEVEVFPKQNEVPATGYGNQFILPLAGKSAPLGPDFAPLPIAPENIWFGISADVPPRTKPVLEYTGATTTEFVQLQKMLDAIPNTDDKELDYDQWRNIIFAIHHETGGSPDGLSLAHAFSAKSAKYDPDLLDNRIWPYITSDRDSAITGRTIAHMAREFGYVEDVTDEFDDLSDESTHPGDVSTKREKFTPIPAYQFTEAPETRWLIKGVLPAGDTAAILAVMYGASGSGKSFQATDMACAIARGIPWRDNRVSQGRVVYVCAEGAGGYRKRLRAYCKHHNIPIENLDVWVIPAAPNLLQGDDVRALITAILAVGPVALVVIDTLAQATAGGNENSGEDMGKAIGHCRTISDVLRCAVLLVHHSGKDADKGARGHSSLRAAADTEFEVLRSDDLRAMRVSKQKDGEEIQDMGFHLEVVPLGLDSDGDQITSCVVLANETTVAEIKGGDKDRGLRGNQKVLLEELDTLLGLDGSGPTREQLLDAARVKIEDASGKKPRLNDLRNTLDKLIQGGKLVFAGGEVRRG